jgi:hypothetical protein
MWSGLSLTHRWASTGGATSHTASVVVAGVTGPLGDSKITGHIFFNSRVKA